MFNISIVIIIYSGEDSSASHHDMSDHDVDVSSDFSDDVLEVDDAEYFVIVPGQGNPQDQPLVRDHRVSYLC